MAGTGGGGSVTPPSLTVCTEYDHNDANAPTCDNTNSISNWEIWSLAFSPDGRLLATAGDDGRVKIWNFDGHKLTASGHVISSNGQTYVAFSPDGATLVVGSNGKLVTYNTASWTLGPAFSGVTGQVRGVAVTADSQRIVTIDGSGTVGKLYVHTLVTGGTPVSSSLAAYPLSLSLEAGSSATNIVAAVGFDTGRAETLQISGSTITPASAFTVETSTSVYVTAAAFAPTGTLLALGDDDGKLQFWANPVSTTTASGAALTFATNGQRERRQRTLLVARRRVPRDRRRELVRLRVDQHLHLSGANPVRLRAPDLLSGLGRLLAERQRARGRRGDLRQGHALR